MHKCNNKNNNKNKVTQRNQHIAIKKQITVKKGKMKMKLHTIGQNEQRRKESKFPKRIIIQIKTNKFPN